VICFPQLTKERAVFACRSSQKHHKRTGINRLALNFCHAAIPAIVLMCISQMSIILAATALLGEEASFWSITLANDIVLLAAVLVRSREGPSQVAA